jgi:hypothetical protein
MIKFGDGVDGERPWFKGGKPDRMRQFPKMKEYPEKPNRMKKKVGMKRLLDAFDAHNRAAVSKKAFADYQMAERTKKAKGIYRVGKINRELRDLPGQRPMTAGDKVLGSQINRAPKPFKKPILARGTGRAAAIVAGLGAISGYFAQKRAARNK